MKRWIGTRVTALGENKRIDSQVKVFSFNNYDVIGLDLDGTILRYNLSEIVPLVYELLSRYLFEHKGYSKNFVNYDHRSIINKDFFQKGLFLDTERGNILKLRCDGYILKACHGTKTLENDKIAHIYGKNRQWSSAKQYIDNPLCFWNGSDNVRSLLDYFDISASLVFARAVDDIDSRKKQNENCLQYKVWPDILDALTQIYTKENFANGKSGFFNKIKEEPDRFLLKPSQTVINWLKELRSKKIVYLLTGSDANYANFIMSHSIGANWRDFFDVVVCFAKKPGFFNASRLFYKIENNCSTDAIEIKDDLKMNSIYSMGNWQQLLKLFANILGKEVNEMKSLYIGDNIIQDVYAPTALTRIDSVAVSEEMLSEHLLGSQFDPLKFAFYDIISSNYWGSYFFVNGESTLWTYFIAKYSKMCIPTLEFVACKPIDHRFCMHNEQGFFPSEPIGVQS